MKWSFLILNLLNMKAVKTSVRTTSRQVLNYDMIPLKQKIKGKFF